MDTTQNVANLGALNLIGNGSPAPKKTRRSRLPAPAVETTSTVATVASLATGIVMAQTLKGTLTSHFDAVCSSFVKAGFNGASVLAGERVRILSLAHPKLSGIHTVRGRGTVEFARAIVEGIEAIDDKELSKALLALWRKASTFFALFRTDKGQSFGVDWAKVA